MGVTKIITCTAVGSIQKKTKLGDFVIATGKGHTIRDLCKVAFEYVGLNWKDDVVVNQKWVRPTETGPLIGDAKKARKILKWRPKTSFKKLIEMMVESDLSHLR